MESPEAKKRLAELLAYRDIVAKLQEAPRGMQAAGLSTYSAPLTMREIAAVARARREVAAEITRQ